MFAAISILGLLGACILLVLVGAARRAPKGYEDGDGFHLGIAPDLPHVVADRAAVAPPRSLGPFKGSAQSADHPDTPTSDR
ncbi:MAG TPA: hypothetical protein VN775_06615 [Opitutaceae bacterium]|nr:hypothetical protein [Opitutaceae bacterium]